MAKVDLRIGGKTYQILCDEGQEAHLRELAGFVNTRVTELGAAKGANGETTVLVLALLSIADELRRAQTGAERIGHGRTRDQSQAELMEALTAGKLEDFADRIEQVVARLEQD